MNIKKLFSRKRKHKNSIEENNKIVLQSDTSGFINENFDILMDSIRQIEEAKIEYQAITSYLQDIQIIDMIPKEHKEAMEEAAKNITILTRERDSFHTNNYKIQDLQYRLFERYEMIIPKELPSIKESEEYNVLIQRDIEHLEAEKQSLLSEKEEVISKQSFLRGITITTIAIVISLFLLFGLITYMVNANLTLPFLLTVLMGMAVVIYIFIESRKNKYNIRMIELKLNKAIMLMNKVKLKLVNNRSFLDYSYNKYMINSYEEFKNRWGEYLKLEEDTKQYKQNTQLLEIYNKQLVKELERFSVSDCEVWIYQANAIIDSREMVEERHRLNIRRQKIRERIEMNKQQKDIAINDIKKLQSEYPDYNETIQKLVKKYNIQLSN